MRRIVVLDSGPAGILTNPRASDVNQRCSEWYEDIVNAGAELVLPEVVDYELRRELLRAGKTRGLRRLDELGGAITYLPLDTAMMREASRLWAEARRRGLPTAPPTSLDVDAILAAQTLSLQRSDTDVILATTNVGHLTQFVTARLWEDIVP